MKRCAALLLCLCTLLPLSGCLSYISVEGYGYVLSISIESGKEKKYVYGFLLQNEDTAKSGETGGENDVQGYLLSAEGDNLYEAMETIKKGVPYVLNFSRASYVVFSEEVAMKEGVADFMGLHLSDLRMRQSLKMLVAEGSAREFLEKLHAPNSPNLAKLQASLSQGYSEAGFIPIINYTLFWEALLGERFDPAATLCSVDKAAEEQKPGEEKPAAGTTGGVLREGGMASYAMGTALFDGSVMVGKLTGEQTKFLLIATGLFNNGVLCFRYAGQEIVLELGASHAPKIDMELEPVPKAQIYIYLDCEIGVDPNGNVKASWENGLQSAVENYMRGELQRLFLFCRELNCDAMGFGKEAARKFSSAESWREYAWKSKYKDMQAEYHVSVSLNDAYITGWME